MIYRFETLKYSSKEVIGVFEKDTNFCKLNCNIIPGVLCIKVSIHNTPIFY